jgi:hypothetical protein
MVKLTTRFVNEIKPTDSIIIKWDDYLKGFGLCIRSSGKKTFILKYRIGRGRRALNKKHSLGCLPVVTLEIAKNKAKSFLLMASQGIDPIKEDCALLTIRELCEQYLERYANP